MRLRWRPLTSLQSPRRTLARPAGGAPPRTWGAHPKATHGTAALAALSAWLPPMPPSGLSFPVGLAIQMKCSFKLPILSFNCLATEWPDYGPLLSQTCGLICSTLSSLCEGRPTCILFSCYTPRTPRTPHPRPCSLLPQPCPWNRGVQGPEVATCWTALFLAQRPCPPAKWGCGTFG